MGTVDLEEGELILAQVGALYHSGLIASPGRVTVTDRRLLFEPKAAYRLMGAKNLVLFVADIERAEIEGINRILQVEVASRAHRFSGPNARAIRDRLASMLDITEDSGADFRAEERILVACDARRRVNKMLATEGKLIATTERIRFRPGGVGSLVWGSAGFECPISAIRGLKVTGRRRQLEMLTDKDTYQVMSGKLGEIHGAIRAIQDHVRAGRNLNSLTFNAVRVLVHQGALATRGDAVFTERRFSFVPTALDRMAAGAERIEVIYDTLLRVDLPREGTKRLTLHVKEGRVALTMEGQEKIFDQLVARMAALPGPSELAVLEGYHDPIAARARVLELWGARLQPGDVDSALFDPTVYLNNRGVAQPGWLLIQEKFASWIPASLPSAGSDVLNLPLAQIRRVDVQDLDSPVIEAVMADQHFAFYPRSGNPIRRTFWEHVDAHKERRAKKTEDSGIDVLNRRETFRVRTFATSPPTILCEARVEGEEPTLIRAQLLDMSMGGCAISVEDKIEKIDQLYFQIKDGKDIRLIEAEIVYQRRIRQPEGFRLGIRFLPRNQGELEHLRSAWMEMQRTMAAQRVV